MNLLINNRLEYNFSQILMYDTLLQLHPFKSYGTKCLPLSKQASKHAHFWHFLDFLLSRKIQIELKRGDSLEKCYETKLGVYLHNFWAGKARIQAYFQLLPQKRSKIYENGLLFQQGPPCGKWSKSLHFFGKTRKSKQTLKR